MGLSAMALRTALLPSALTPEARRRRPRFSHADASFGLAFTARWYSDVASFGAGPVRKIARLNRAGSYLGSLSRAARYFCSASP